MTPIAESTAFRPAVTGVAPVQETPSVDVATKTSLAGARGPWQSCQVAQIRPAESTSADGNGKTRKPRIPHENAATSAIRTGGAKDAAPSRERDAAMENGSTSQR